MTTISFLFIQDGTTYRGCASSLANCDSSKKCILCDSSNCNGQSLNSNASNSFKTNTECMHCDSKTDSKCIKDLHASLSKVCKNDDDQCFTHIGRFSIMRGCLSDQNADFVENCQNDDEKCSLCNEKNCNNENILLETCIGCNSTIDEKCAQHLASYKGKICNTIDSNDTLGCFLSSTVSARETLFFESKLI